MSYCNKKLDRHPSIALPLPPFASTIHRPDLIAFMPTEQEIIDYYFDSKLDYQLYNLRVDDLAMHYGLWDQNVRSHRQALLNENRVLASTTGVKQSDHVIDLGCGYGSTAVWLADHVGCHVSGITISQNQIDEARRLARKHNVDNLADFRRMDYHQT